MLSFRFAQDSPLEGDGLPHFNKNKGIDWQTALSASIDIKGLFGELANLSQARIFYTGAAEL
jgi:hypothetical protein